MRDRSASWVVVMVISTVLAAVVVIGTGALVVAGEMPARQRQDVRAEVLRAASDGVVAINTVRPQTLTADLDRAESVQAEPMLTEYRRVRPRFAQSLSAAQAVVIARAVEAGVQLDDPVRPNVIVAIEVTASSATAQPSIKQQLFTVDMVQVGGVWKLSRAMPATGQT
ncbi:hypothetical protein ACQPX6_25150 [Actinomycetospora sp. CA-101289]|uniref:hypothetical protein n=1 Tax=Actinomycetospora sp. CA-101289 TaxID=3239893 RepID=UPI003D96CBA0